MSGEKTKPNIVLISVDQWRGDCLSIDNHPVVHTPYLDELATAGARFSRAYTAVASCISARCALMTGLHQARHGRVGYCDGVDWNYPLTVAGELARGGYHTQCVGKMHVHPIRTLLGFHNIVLHDGYLTLPRVRNRDMEQSDDYLPWLRLRTRHDADYYDHGMDCNAYTVRPWDKEESLHPTNFIVSQSIDFLRRRDDRLPFFLYMSFHRPHPPLDPPAWAFEQYVNRKMPDPPVGDWAELFRPIHAPRLPALRAGEMDPELLQRARAGYYGHITHIDHQIKRFLAALVEFQVNHNTWVFFLSDHGDLMGDHHLYRKSLAYEGSTRIPLIVRPPVGVKFLRNKVHDQVVELRDIMPTLLDCADLPIPESIDGKSLLPILQGKTAEEINWRDCLQGEHTIGRIDGTPELENAMYITDGKEKYLWYSGQGIEQLFDLVNDPQELTDLARKPEMQHRVAHWRARLAQELTGREEGYSDGKQLIPGRPVESVLSFLRKNNQA